jgi:sortase A
MRSIIRFCGELCLTAGVIGLLFVAYLVWGTGMRTAGIQRQFSAELNRQWHVSTASGLPGCDSGSVGLASSTVPTVPLGPAARVPADPIQLMSSQPFAFLQIPAFGAQWRFTLIEGTTLAQLDTSPGHVPGTQLPGQLGNFVVAGHRVTAGNPFWSLPSLRAGDLVCVDTQYNTYTYRVTGHPVLVSPTDLAVLDPVPGHPEATPVGRLISLITCDPAWTGTHRVIVTGQLVEVKPR